MCNKVKGGSPIKSAEDSPNSNDTTVTIRAILLYSIKMLFQNGLLIHVMMNRTINSEGFYQNYSRVLMILKKNILSVLLLALEIKLY